MSRTPSRLSRKKPEQQRCYSCLARFLWSMNLHPVHTSVHLTHWFLQQIWIRYSVWMCVLCMYLCMCLCMFVCMCVSACMCLCVCSCVVCVYVNACMCLCVCLWGMGCVCALCWYKQTAKCVYVVGRSVSSSFLKCNCRCGKGGHLLKSLSAAHIRLISSCITPN